MIILLALVALYCVRMFAIRLYDSLMAFKQGRHDEALSYANGFLAWGILWIIAFYVFGAIV